MHPAIFDPIQPAPPPPPQQALSFRSRLLKCTFLQHTAIFQVMNDVLTWLCIAVNDFLSRTKTNVYLRTFAPIATAHFFAHVTHSSCIADYEGKQTWQLVINKGANIFHKNGTQKHVASWDSCGPRSSRKCHAISDSVNRQSL